MSSETDPAPLPSHAQRMIRRLNAVGNVVRALGLQWNLSVTRLRRAAERQTGLSDWGPDRLSDVFERVVTLLEADKLLTPLGRFLAKRGLQHVLATRLRIQYAVNQQPSLVDRPVTQPIIVAGLPRTGTTLLHNLLAQTPEGRPLLLWEGVHPAPLGPRFTGPDQRAESVRKMVAKLQRAVPQMATAHAINADGPEECTFLLNYAYILPTMNEVLLAGERDPLFQLTDEQIVEAYRYHKLQLQILQGDQTPQWVLKAACHIFGLYGILTVYPDACVVQTHRDPRQFVPSFASLTELMINGILQRTDHLGEAVAMLLVQRVRRGMQAREHFPAERVCDVQYRDLVSSPIETVRGIYDHFGLEFSDEHERRCQAWLAANPQHKHGVHRYSLEQYGLTEQRINNLFAFYTDRHLAAPQRA